MTDLLYSEVEEDLRSTVRSLLAARSTGAQVIRRIETTETYDTALWRSLAVDLGLAGLIVPEKLGGAGASYREAAVVCEEIGRAVAPVPFLGSAIVATAALLACGETDILGALARGERTAVLAVPFTAYSSVATVVVGDGGLSGTVTSVADALPADVLLVPTADGLYAVDAADAVRTPVVSLDMTRQLADLTFDNVAGTRVADAATSTAAVDAALLAGAAMLASEQLGLATWCLSTTVDYMKTRYQFGRQIGSFQALKHRIADVWVDVTQARAVARYAADCAATGDADLPIAVSVGQAFNGPMAVRTAEECLQLHGGIGFTWEYPIHLYLKRAKADSLAYGTAGAHREILATLADIPGPA